MKSFILKLHSKLYKTIKWIFRFSTSNILRGPCLYCSSLCFSFGLLLLNTVHYHNKSLKNDDWEQCDRILACLKGKSSLLWTTDFLKQNKVTWSIRARQFLAAIMYLPVWKKKRTDDLNFTISLILPIFLCLRAAGWPNNHRDLLVGILYFYVQFY